MSLRFPGATKSPSTPNRKKSLFSNPSTTPAGPPPSHLTQPSTTPVGPPPRSSFFTSSKSYTGKNTFGKRGATPGRRGFVVPSSSPPLEEEDDDEEDVDVEEDDAMGDVQEYARDQAPSPEKSAFMSSIMSAPRGLKRSRNGQVREQVGSDFASIARGLTGHTPSAAFTEPDDMLLHQEVILSRMENGRNMGAAQEAATQLTRLWAQHADSATKEGKLGPESDDAFTKANYLTTLLLQIHHPHRLNAQQAPRTQNSSAVTKHGSDNTCTIPRALLDWLDIYHNPFPDEFHAISQNSPSPSDHDRFWDAIYASLVRGRFQQSIALFRNAGWEHAYTAEEDSQPDGYSQRQLENIEEVAEHAARLIESCPAVRYDEWDVKGSDWKIFRQRVRQALKDLERFAGEEEDEDAGLSKQGENVFSMSAATKRAESKVPWSIFTNLKLSYDILLGSADEITDASQDWLEACIYATAWWDGEEDGTGLVVLNKGSLRKSITAGQRPREVDLSPIAAYRNRLADAFAYVTDTDEPLFVPETMDPIHVGLGCVLSNGIESVVRLLRTWSLPITAGLVEVAALAGWLPQARPRSRELLEQGFSSEDLMVLSHGPGGGQREQLGELVRDDVLSEYAGALAGKDVLHSSDGKSERDGWELAVAVLGRLDDEIEGERNIGELLDQIELSDEARVDKILIACQELELVEQARGIAERYADTLASTTRSYGPALLYLARARSPAKLKSTLGLLASLCLIHSSAYPAPADLDPQLASLLSGPRNALVALACIDSDAANLLASHLSGYATLRRFYQLRDQSQESVEEQGTLRPLARAREAAKALLAVLASASDCICGGLFDPDTESVLPVDGVLALLGELLPLLGRRKRVFSQEQVFFLLRVVEDFASAPSRVREDAEEMLGACLGAYREEGGSASGTLRKSRSDLARSSASAGLGGSTWDMLASSTMATSRSGEKAAAVEVARGWDWRKGLESIGTTVGEEGAAGRDVIMMVRTALAQEAAEGWTGGMGW
ncbi:hypothetical protein LTR54_003411 [Friedmanniomyces endolithicus]|nr:hypothetical protein LTR54_003411 [Friedmanniomyces endolithicus]